jgi:hypothetical protein
MAIDYSADIATDLSSLQLLELLSDLLGYAKLSSSELDVPGVLVRAAASTPIGQEVAEELFHFAPTVSLSFRVEKELDMRRVGYLSMFRICNALLEKTNYDMVFLWNDEAAKLLRVGGHLVLDESDGFWRPIFLDCIRVPYETRILPRL